MPALWLMISAVCLFFLAALAVPFPFDVSPGWLGIFCWSLALVLRDVEQYRRFARTPLSRFS